MLKKHRSKFSEALIITETVFSMDGDIPPLKELVNLKEKYRCKIMVDEAHATGVFGECGSGVVEEEGLNREVDLIMGTFSKALGSFGAYLACSEEVKKYLINACRSFIYSTALPPSIIAANLKSLEIIRKESHRRETLLVNAAAFCKGLKERGLSVKGNSQIVPVIIGQTKRAVKMAEQLKSRGYWVFPIRPPTVPSGQARLRFSLTYYHSGKLLRQLIEDICELGSF